MRHRAKIIILLAGMSIGSNPGAVQEVLSGERKTANAAWWGFNTDDSTDALQAAIDSGASKVIVPYTGSPWIVRPIKLTSDLEITFEPGVIVVAKRGEFKGKNDSLFQARGKQDIILRGYGATFKMQKADYTDPNMYEKSEWRMGIWLRACTNVQVYGLTIRETGGDGVYIGAVGDAPCRDIVIRDITCTNNHRQGLSVISVDNLLIENCLFQDTDGTKPCAGVDIEPNSATCIIANIVVRNCVSRNNTGSGFLVYLLKLTEASHDVSILFDNCFDDGNGRPIIKIGSGTDGGPNGLVEYRNCTIINNRTQAVALFDQSLYPKRIRLHFNNCKWGPVVF